MKKIIILLCCLWAIVAQAQNVNIPDANFKNYLISMTNINTNGDTEIQVSEAQAFTGTINCSSQNIADLTGIEAFVNLTELRCQQNQLTNLNTSTNTALTYIVCWGNQITSLDLSNNVNLQVLGCDNNQLSSLDISNNTTLTELYCGGNQLSSLDVSVNTSLIKLYCWDNQLSSLDVSNNTALEELGCHVNSIANINVANNTNLKTLACRNNLLTNLNVSNNTALIRLHCDGNQLTNLDVSVNSNLRLLDCKNNQLSTLNVANGNNWFMGSNSYFRVETEGNPNLTCIQIDANFSPTIWWSKDISVAWSSDCATYTPCSQMVNIPDTNFRNRLLHHTPSIDINSDGIICLNEAQAFTGTINCSNRNIGDLTGIEAFTNTSKLYCYNNQLSSLDISNNIALTNLRCNNNQLNTLDISNNDSLGYLNCGNNQIGSLDVSNNIALTDLRCNNNQLSSLDVSNNINLTGLECDSNQLTNLNVQNNNNSNISLFRSKGNPNLTCIQIDTGFNPPLFYWQKDTFVVWSSNCATYTPCSQIVNIPDVNFKNTLLNYGITTGTLVIDTDGDGEICLNEAQAFTGTIDCSNRNITDLTGIETFTNLKALDCSYNQLTSINVSQNVNLEKLIVWHNQLTHLDVSQNVNLIHLDADENQLTDLDISNNIALEEFGCRDNQLTSIDVSANINLKTFWCYRNQITSLDVSNNTALTKLYCWQNQLTHLDLSANDSLTYLRCDTNQLEYLNLANGNNDSLTYLLAVNNPNLTCIQHDNGFTPPAWATNNGWRKDATANWSSDCGYVLVSSIAVQGQGGVYTISTQGGTLQMEANILPTNASYKTYTWSVANGTGSATINANGLLTAVADGTVIVTATANDASATTGSATITISNQSVSINDIVFEGLKVYPNPTNGKLHIDLAHNQLNEINILDLTGKKIKQYTKQLHTIDISNLAKGVYFLELKNNNKHTTIKIIKK